MINALLGGSFLADGILPTTNEISVLKFRWGSLCMLATSRSAVAVPQRVCSIGLAVPEQVMWCHARSRWVSQGGSKVY